MEASSLVDLCEPRELDSCATVAVAAIAKMMVGGMISTATSTVLAGPVSLGGVMMMMGESDLSPTAGAHLEDSLVLGFLPFFL